MGINEYVKAAGALAGCVLAAAVHAGPAEVHKYTSDTATTTGTSPLISAVDSIRPRIPFIVYQPEGYTAGVRYPVVVYLHGRGGRYDGDTDQSSLRASYEQARALGRIGPVIIVVPDGYGASFDGYPNPVETGWSDSHPSAALKIPNETDVWRVIRHVDQTYGTLGADGRAIIGHSMGGGGAAKFASKYPQEFLAWVGFDAPLNDWASGNINLAHYVDEAWFNQNGNPWYWVHPNTPTASGGGSNVSQLIARGTRYRQVVGSSVGRENNPAFRDALLAADITDFDKVELNATPNAEYKHFESGHRFSSILAADGTASWEFLNQVYTAAGAAARDVASTAARDGFVPESGAGTGQGGAPNTTSANLLLGDAANGARYRSVLSFDLRAAGLNANAIVESAVLKLTRTVANGSPQGRIRGEVRAGYFGASDRLQPDDFAEAVPVPVGIDQLEVPANGVRTAARVNTSGLQAINTSVQSGSGLVQIRLAYDVLTGTSGADTRGYASANHATESFRPVLTLRYRQP